MLLIFSSLPRLLKYTQLFKLVVRTILLFFFEYAIHIFFEINLLKKKGNEYPSEMGFIN